MIFLLANDQLQLLIDFCASYISFSLHDYHNMFCFFLARPKQLPLVDSYAYLVKNNTFVTSDQLMMTFVWVSSAHDAFAVDYVNHHHIGRTHPHSSALPSSRVICTTCTDMRRYNIKTGCGISDVLYRAKCHTL